MMNREIKFRGKSINTQAWVYCYYYAVEKNCVLFHFIIDKAGKSHEVYYHTVEQFTGMPDKNGVEIYEGDILENREPYNDLERAVIRWNNKLAKFVFDMYYDGDTEIAETLEANDWISLDHFEVIGNIHDNPDLIGGRQGE